MFRVSLFASFCVFMCGCRLDVFVQRQIKVLSPCAVYTSGKASTAAGLTAVISACVSLV